MKQKITITLSYLAATDAVDESTLEQIRSLHACGVGGFELKNWEQRAASMTAAVPFDGDKPNARAVAEMHRYLLRHVKRLNAQPIYRPSFNLQIEQENGE